MHLEWQNGYLHIGRDRLYRPGRYRVYLGWNDRLTYGRPSPEGELRCADEIEIFWYWPRDPHWRNFGFRRWKMDWRDFWGLPKSS